MGNVRSFRRGLESSPSEAGETPADVFAEAQQVIQPSPTPVVWLAAVADFPDALKGTTTRLVVVDQYDQLGMRRVFLEPAAAKAVAEQMIEAAKLAGNRGVQVVEGAAAHHIAREATKVRD